MQGDDVTKLGTDTLGNLGTGVQNFVTARTGQTIFGWTKKDLDKKIIGHFMARAKISCLTLTTWTFGSL